MPFGLFQYDFHHKKGFKIYTVIKAYKRRQGYKKADEQS